MPAPAYVTYAAEDPVSKQLAAADPQLGALIDRIGEVSIGPLEGGFGVIARSIVSQQLSEKAASTIWGRVHDRVGVTPEAIEAAPPGVLRKAGLSGRKVEYLTDLARATLAGDIDWDGIAALDDEAAIEQLVALRGVGRWTAEMYLIFALGRPDVLALDDMGVRASAGRMMGLGRSATRDELAERGESWRPHRSAASLWLWRDLGGPR